MTPPAGENIKELVAGPDGGMWFTDGWWPEGAYHGTVGRISAEGSISEFEEGLGARSDTEEIVAGPDGNLWFADAGDGSIDNAIGRVTPSGTINEFTEGLETVRPRTIIDGVGNRLWFTANGSSPAIGSITTAGVISKFILPGPPHVPVLGPEGNVWFTYGESGSGAIGRVVQEEGGTTVITLFSKGLASASIPQDIVLGREGDLWFTDVGKGVGAIGRVTPAGAIEEFRAGLGEESRPRQLVAGPDGDLWFTDRPERAIGRITPNGTITEFGSENLTRNGGPWGIAFGPEGEVWFTGGSSNGAAGAIGKLSPASGQITLFNGGADGHGLGLDTTPKEIAAGPAGTLWFVGSTGPTETVIGRIIPGDDALAEESLRSPYQPEIPQSPKTIARLKVVHHSVFVSRRGRAVIDLECIPFTSCFGILTLKAKSPRWRGPDTIGETHFAIRSGNEALIGVPLDRAGRSLLHAAGGRHSAQVTVEGQMTFEVVPRRSVRLVQTKRKNTKKALRP
jgi:streptogramin lyase